ncbi:hypothetical protein BVY03_02225 [bacterium K02(2017)]|nr:hypothetical protein BVY03_02225 [bacterium K02(2017)]
MHILINTKLLKLNYFLKLLIFNFLGGSLIYYALNIIYDEPFTAPSLISIPSYPFDHPIKLIFIASFSFSFIRLFWIIFVSKYLKLSLGLQTNIQFILSVVFCSFIGGIFILLNNYSWNGTISQLFKFGFLGIFQGMWCAFISFPINITGLLYVHLSTNYVDKSFKIKSDPITPEKVIVTETNITHYLSNGEVNTLNWSELEGVQILTTDEGPIQEDIYFMLSSTSEKDGCIVPQSAEGTQQLIDKILLLPGFNLEKFTEAMGSTHNNLFTCWTKKTY